MSVDLSFARDTRDVPDLKPILVEYLEWDISQLREVSGVDVSVDAYVENTFRELEVYFPPDGRLLLARDEGRLVGIGFLKPIRDGTCEIKRMYVRPSHRGIGLGREILCRLIDEARGIGYASVMLDSAVYMKRAHALYRSLGFVETEYYAEGETEAALNDYLIYMELRL